MSYQEILQSSRSGRILLWRMFEARRKRKEGCSEPEEITVFTVQWKRSIRLFEKGWFRGVQIQLFEKCWCELLALIRLKVNNEPLPGFERCSAFPPSTSFLEKHRSGRQMIQRNYCSKLAPITVLKLAVRSVRIAFRFSIEGIATLTDAALLFRNIISPPAASRPGCISSIIEGWLQTFIHL